MTPAIGHKQWVVVRVKPGAHTHRVVKDTTAVHQEEDDFYGAYVAAYGPFDSEALASAFAWSYGEALKTHLALVLLNAEL